MSLEYHKALERCSQMKKGDLSINIIIVAAIALIILVIISVLVFGTGSQLSFAKSCVGLQGQCIADSDSCSDISTEEENWILHRTAKCQGEDLKCCIKQ
jgi:hypothetical protein